MKNFINHLETMGLTNIKDFTGINAVEEPHAAFLNLLCDYKFSDKEQVLFLTGLSPEEYNMVFQELPEQGIRELKVDQESLITLLISIHMEDSLPHQEQFCRLLFYAMEDFAVEAKKHEKNHLGEIPMGKEFHLEELFRKESVEPFAKLLNAAIISIWGFLAINEMEDDVIS